jgi:cytoskeletal protein CcmA (bactofilin family)
MWGNKKSHTPQAADPEPKNWQTNQPPKRTPASWEGTTKMNKDVMRPAGATADRATARLGSSLHVKGEISGNEDLYIDGTVEGLVQLDERKLTVGATAKLTADVIAGEVIVYGSVNGNVHGKGKIEIKKYGSVNGDLTTAQIMIEDGAYFSIEIEKSAEKEGDKNLFSTASAPAAAEAEQDDVPLVTVEGHLKLGPSVNQCWLNYFNPCAEIIAFRYRTSNDAV